VLPVEQAGWTDLGEPERVINALGDTSDTSAREASWMNLERRNALDK
jgi:hypothetical protein